MNINVKAAAKISKSLSSEIRKLAAQDVALKT